MQLILFSKFLQDKDIAGLIEVGKELGLDGYDLAVRDGYVVNLDNVGQKLPELVKEFENAGLSVPMVTTPWDMVEAADPKAEPIVAAMGKSGVGLLKIGYKFFYPEKGEDYWATVDDVRSSLEAWEKLGEKHGVKICYHTHCAEPRIHMGGSCAGLMHLIKGFDPKYIGAYIDPGHLVVDGEPFDFGIAMVREYLSAVALKDVLLFDQKSEVGDEGTHARKWVTAGNGMVEWSQFFAELAQVGYDGPLSVHAEYETDSREQFLASLEDEVTYFRRKLNAAIAK